ncbi:MAG: NYN domain-containing protein [Spirochaetaceae bacterium]|jgi:uncharacterized LabA/DUF88 family protein|nr:NYN domain-containing protein [Spirochaetaceae bacterium]
MIKTAILVDGGFYRKRAAYLWGQKSAIDRANELVSYCKLHLKEKHDINKHYLYRIFYYDCPPIDKQVYHPFLRKNIDFKQTDTYRWSVDFLNELKTKRKLAIRLGKLADSTAHYNLKPEITKKVFSQRLNYSDITEGDFVLNLKQKGVDMKIGIDIASLAYKKQVDQIVLIAGDSDFVPVAKLARREGLDFILDPLWADVPSDLFEHIDGLRSCKRKKRENNLQVL